MHEQQREEPTLDEFELDRRARSLPIALTRVVPSQPQFSVKFEREDEHEAGPEAA